MTSAFFRSLSFVALAVAAAALWLALFHSTAGVDTATPGIPAATSQSVFAPMTQFASGLTVGDIVRSGACSGCVVHIGAGARVEAKVPSGGGDRAAYALLVVDQGADQRPVLVHDVIGFGRGQVPARPVPLLEMLDSSHRVIFELVAWPDRRLYLTSPAGGLRATSLRLATGATVPNDGVSGVALDVAWQPNRSLVVSVNGVRTAAVRQLSGGRTGGPRFLATGVIGYQAPSGAITATHAQVSVSTSSSATTGTPPSSSSTTQAAAPPVTAPPAAAARPLSSLAPPTVAGSAVVGSTLTADPGSWSNNAATFTYAWERCDSSGSCTAIDGATGRTYDLAAADRGALVRVVVTAQAGDARVSAASSAVGPVLPAAPTELALPRVSGEAIVGTQLSADPGRWSDPAPDFSFVWLRCDDTGACTTIDGADGSTYTLTTADLGFAIEVAVIASNAGGTGTADSAPTDLVVPAAPVVVSGPTVSGNTIVGSTLTAAPGVWSDPGATFAYAWLRCDDTGACTAIDGAAGSTYTLSAADVGFAIEAAVTASNAGGAGTADSARTGVVVPAAPVVVSVPTVGGDTIVGSTLTATPGVWSDPAATFAYAWLRCDDTGACTAIDGAAGSTYTLTAADVGFGIEAAVTASNAGGTGTADSAPTAPVTAPPPPTPISAPSISGYAIVGSTLTADPGVWSDPAATFAYAWLRCDHTGACTPIEGADGSTLVLTADERCYWIRVEVTATDAGGSETAESPPTARVRGAGRHFDAGRAARSAER